jgi:hypothetical protein
MFVGCETMKTMSRPKEINGVKCMSSPYLQVLQVIDDGILAHICPTSYSSVYDDAFDACVVEGDTVFMEVPKDKNFFVDDQKITLNQNQCFVGVGTFAYNSSGGRRRTVRSITIIAEQEPPAKSSDEEPGESKGEETSK